MSAESSSSELNEVMTIKNIVKVGKNYKHCTHFSDFVRATYPSVELLMPKSEEIVRTPENKILNIYRDDADELYSLKKMCALSHKNLLSCYYYQEADDNICKMFNESKNFAKEKNATYYMVLTEEVCGTLDNFINGKQFSRLTIRGYLPSIACLQLIWDIINAIRYLHSKQTYHGNFSRLSTPFVYQGFFEQAQRGDWFTFGTFLLDILLASGNAPVNIYTADLSRVVDYFQNITMDQILHMDQGLRQFDFFMTCEDRWIYCRKLPSWCINNAPFLRTHANFVHMPWNSFNYPYGTLVLNSMNNFKDRDGKKKYDSNFDVNNIISFLRFVSGVYAHYNSFKHIKQFSCGRLKFIDAFICTEFPDLFYHLRAMESIGGF